VIVDHESPEGPPVTTITSIGVDLAEKVLKSMASMLRIKAYHAFAGGIWL
jgi:hypothetical protein